MKIASIADVKARFNAYLKEIESGPLVITRNGRPVGVLLAVKDEDEIERLILGCTPRLRAMLDAAHRRIEAKQGTPPKESAREVHTAHTEPPEPVRARPKRRRPQKK
jgi:prevent-host-death family protein